ncbi:MAG TPA: lipid II flippase MurJ, partial [Acidimicrobiales bacterium]|nr:lipid II flippase MurJ [Acidimicrobiales bacterium]
LAVTAVLGATFLGNTYQQSNLVSTVLFELLAAGLLTVPLVPALVARPDDGPRLLGALWGLSLLVLGVLALILAALGRPVMAALTSTAPPEVASQQAALGAFLLWFFAPQLVLYAAGAITSAYLNARGRFSAAAAGPVANNVVVMATMGTFYLVEGPHPSLMVSTAGKLVLGIGTTLGVAAMSALPAIAAARNGLRLRPTVDWREPMVAAVAREGMWAGALIGAQQVLLAATLILANRIEGGVVATQLAFTFFLLPHALLAHPIYTSAFPTLAAHAAADDREAFRSDIAKAVKRLFVVLLPAAVVLALAGEFVLRMLRIGAFEQAGVELTASALRAYCVGLVAYGVFMLLCRSWAALGETRVAGLVAMTTAVGGGAAMILLSSVTSGAAVVSGLALSHSITMTVAALLLGVLLMRRLRT